jgi:hypothetical protein
MLPDLAVANYGTPGNARTGSVSVLLYDATAPGTFLNAVTYPLRARGEHLAIGDLNEDGTPDLVLANGAGHGKVWGLISILFQDPVIPGTFLPAKQYEGIFQASSVAVGDLDGDNLNDIAVADEGIRIRFQDPASPGEFLSLVRVDN